ncbi:MAG: NirD/YgiW/YdeI family stress tolerance protein [Gammaproteobacteria bacterium]|nr:NirD/YgiW/YdeI family stress tolerance protein [Gammaproteobacteria bacterium]
MKKLLTITSLALCALGATAAEPAGGFKGPDNLRLVTAAEASQLADDTVVKLQGFIVRALGDEKYEFRDDSGTITVEIDEEDWGGVTATPDARVELRGEIDRDRYPARVEVDVDSVRLLP